MTVVVGQRFVEGNIMMMADSRISVLGGDKNPIPWKDIAQKIIRLDTNLFIAYSGNVEFAANIIYFIMVYLQKYPKYKNLQLFKIKAPKIIRHAYNVLSKEFREKRDVEFMVGATDFSRPARDSKGRIVGIAIFNNFLFKMVFPNNTTEEASFNKPILIMGSGSPAIDDQDLKEMQLKGLGGLQNFLFICHVITYGIKTKVKELGIETVGGMYQIISIHRDGSGFTPYETIDDRGELTLGLKLNSDGTRYIQYNKKTGKEITLLYPDEILKITNKSRELFCSF